MREKPATSAGHDPRGPLMKFTRTAQLALTAVAAAAPLARVLPAQARTSTDLSTDSPLATFLEQPHSTGLTVIKYSTTVYCSSGLSTDLTDQRSDDDTPDFIPATHAPRGITTYSVTFTSTS